MRKGQKIRESLTNLGVEIPPWMEISDSGRVLYKGRGEGTPILLFQKRPAYEVVVYVVGLVKVWEGAQMDQLMDLFPRETGYLKEYWGEE